MPKEKKGESFFVLNKTKEKVPALPFKKIKKVVLGETYSLSLVFAGEKLSRNLNKKHRGIDKSTDVLSFPLEKKEGEIFINLRRVRQKAPLFKKSFKKYLGFVFIHGLLHLKGFEHGSRMESEEKKFTKLFDL